MSLATTVHINDRSCFFSVLLASKGSNYQKLFVTLTGNKNALREKRHSERISYYVMTGLRAANFSI